ncbi:tetratricopeptide repeat protein [Streptomyces sp. NPDC090025]|uniref:tetratricopeptide repeat protein n=1 Tax=Streptomyces sp. NPDC090025 TaxID=3365922 RepID=UPI0038354245
MKTENVSRAVLAGGAAAVLAATALLYVPELIGRNPPPPPGPAERAADAAHAGAQAALPDLAALIGDRETWLRAHPADDASWAVLAAAYTERGLRRADPADLPRAEAAVKRSLAARGAAAGNLDAQIALAALANARGDWAGAKVWGERVRKAAPKRWTAYPVLIDAYNGLGDYKAAGKATETLTELHSGAAVSGRNAQLFRDRGWREDAGATAQDAVALAESGADKAAALTRLGDLAWERGEPAEAAAQYGAALGLVPEHGPALAGRARTHAALGRGRDAVRDWRAAVERLPLPEYLLEAAELNESLGLDGDARALYERARTVAGAPGAPWPGGEVALGLLDADHGDPADAVRLLRAAWGRGHRSVQVADALGWALFRTGEPKEALPYAKRATDEGLRSALFSYHRGEIERALEDYGPARRHLAEALRINPAFSPLLAPRAKEAVAALGDPPDELPKELPKEPRSEDPAARQSSGAKANASKPKASQGNGSRTGGGAARP